MVRRRPVTRLNFPPVSNPLFFQFLGVVSLSDLKGFIHGAAGVKIGAYILDGGGEIKMAGFIITCLGVGTVVLDLAGNVEYFLFVVIFGSNGTCYSWFFIFVLL